MTAASLFFAFWVDDLNPFLGPHWGNFGIRYYGLGYVFGFVAAWWLLLRYARAGRSQLPAANVEGLMIAMMLGVVVGGRLGIFLLYEPGALLADPLALVRTLDGGMSSHGGFIGVTVALGLFSYRHRLPFLHLGDLIASVAPPGLFLVRVGNFINGELWGKPARVPWAVIFPRSAAPDTPVHLILPRHPSQLYEAALEGLVLLAFMQWRFWRSDIVRTRPGRLTGEFLVAYAVARTVGEIFREPDASLILGLSRGTFYSTFLAAAGLALILLRPATAPVAEANPKE